MTWLITSDWHLTDRPEHEYRIRFLNWLEEQALHEDVTRVFVLGDISDAKDHHSARLVNTIATATRRIGDVAAVDFLFGNHDGPSPDRPFWAFLGSLKAGYAINYHVKTTVMALPCGPQHTSRIVILSPWGGENETLGLLKKHGHAANFVFMHASVSGARVENGVELTGAGLCPNRFVPSGWKGRVISGDIHVPQRIGDVEYVGAPYHVHYGDPFKGRIIKLDPLTGTSVDLHFEDAPRLHTLRMDIDNTGIPQRLHSGDRIKIIAHATRTILPSDWQRYIKDMRALIETAGAELISATLERRNDVNKAVIAPSRRRPDEAIVRTFASRNEYNEATTELGVAIIKNNV